MLFTQEKETLETVAAEHELDPLTRFEALLHLVQDFRHRHSPTAPVLTTMLEIVGHALKGSGMHWK